jgi:hypothetical protein
MLDGYALAFSQGHLANTKRKNLALWPVRRIDGSEYLLNKEETG